MMRGLQELHTACIVNNITFTILTGPLKATLTNYIHNNNCCALVTDFEPLQQSLRDVHTISTLATLPFFQVDAHNIVPCWHASSKQEFGAYTLRPKLQKLLPTFLEDFPAVVRHPYGLATKAEADFSQLVTTTPLNRTAGSVQWIHPGESAAQQAMASFVNRLNTYSNRNDPTQIGQSNLSPYLHFGQLSAQRLALTIKEHITANESLREQGESFLEELIVRRELSDNFTFYNPRYAEFEGFPAWAQFTLHQHRADKREYIYTLDAWERAATHDNLWNASQRELITTGKMHGYMRMYWAKKILEWSQSPEEALATAIYLNDLYELDGNDPNGYAGISWSIGGVHDRAWSERSVYGKIRYMNANGCARKFDVAAYIQMHS